MRKRKRERDESLKDEMKERNKKRDQSSYVFL